MSERQENRVFGRKAEKHILILASGDRIRHMTIQPWIAAVALCFIAMITIGYLLATTYLVLRDDLIGAAMTRQTRMQRDYEERIAALRAQVDRITSRQLLDQQAVEEKIKKLLEQQTALSSRRGKLGSALERAEDFGLDARSAPAPIADTVKPEERADMPDPFKGILTASDTQKTRQVDFAIPGSPLAYAPDGLPVAAPADQLLSKAILSLKAIETDQIIHIENLTADATDHAARIGKILKSTGVAVPEKTAGLTFDLEDESAIGGPYTEPQPGNHFETTLAELDMALDRLERVRAFARKLPFSNPAPGKSVTSSYGNRIDPFFGKLAMHAGIDFRQPIGGKVVAAGSGKVIHAGPAGGYGTMVEIDHGNGITTRYGHLSKTLAAIGDIVDAGAVIALSGSTGRSTGPHLHYEVRCNGVAVDPMRFLNAGMKLTKYLD